MFNKKLQSLRKSKKMTQDELANRLSINRGTYANYERGHRQPDFETLIKIADYFEVTTDYLLGRNEYAHGVSKEEPSVYLQLGLDRDEFESLTAYQQEALNWAANNDYLQFKNKSDDIMDMIERIEIAYEVDKVMKKRKKNNK
ncbi:helix-turn-helix domain-containing protein [Planococcus citreus]|uniref:DNA-binding XRE family transcriptional regulator n=1 Tax=Planococcus citreus TaxID=1373 RepID=A0A497YIZ8_9BACL|nr:helix-turn-helix transcriptional regulator [Planococcus citreus]RLJ90165.1 DNA-binding XRE family transcriptional regulator [Planococcus citreus]